MPWLAFNELGDLPIGVYRATLAEIFAHVGHGTAQRVTITARLERIYALVRRTGAVQRFIIFGSYITAEPNPRDVDIFLVMRGSFQPRDAPPEAQRLFEHGTTQNELGTSIFWVNAGTSFADTEDLIIGWQMRRDLQRRGIVEVVEHDAE
jgi:predicted nucleotidyltransferase